MISLNELSVLMDKALTVNDTKMISNSKFEIILNEIKKLEELKEQTKKMKHLSVVEPSRNRDNAADILMNEDGFYKVPYKGSIKILDNRELDDAIDLLMERPANFRDHMTEVKKGRYQEKSSDRRHGDDSRGEPNKKRSHEGTFVGSRSGRSGSRSPARSERMVRTFGMVIANGNKEGHTRSDKATADLAQAKLNAKVENRLDKLPKFQKCAGGFKVMHDGEDCDEALLHVKFEGRIIHISDARESLKNQTYVEVYRG